MTNVIDGGVCMIMGVEWRMTMAEERFMGKALRHSRNSEPMNK